MGDGRCHTCKFWIALNHDTSPQQGQCDGVRLHNYHSYIVVEPEKSEGATELRTEAEWGCMSHSDYTAARSEAEGGG